MIYWKKTTLFYENGKRSFCGKTSPARLQEAEAVSAADRREALMKIPNVFFKATQGFFARLKSPAPSVSGSAGKASAAEQPAERAPIKA